MLWFALFTADLEAFRGSERLGGLKIAGEKSLPLGRDDTMLLNGEAGPMGHGDELARPTGFDSESRQPGLFNSLDLYLKEFRMVPKPCLL